MTDPTCPNFDTQISAAKTGTEPHDVVTSSKAPPSDTQDDLISYVFITAVIILAIVVSLVFFPLQLTKIFSNIFP